MPNTEQVIVKPISDGWGNEWGWGSNPEFVFKDFALRMAAGTFPVGTILQYHPAIASARRGKFTAPRHFLVVAKVRSGSMEAAYRRSALTIKGETYAKTMFRTVLDFMEENGYVPQLMGWDAVREEPIVYSPFAASFTLQITRTMKGIFDLERSGAIARNWISRLQTAADWHEYHAICHEMAESGLIPWEGATVALRGYSEFRKRLANNIADYNRRNGIATGVGQMSG